MRRAVRRGKVESVNLTSTPSISGKENTALLVVHVIAAQERVARFGT